MADAIETLIHAVGVARHLGVSRPAMPPLKALIVRASDLLNHIELELEHDPT